MSNKSTRPASDEIWSLIKETNKQIKTLSSETDKQIKTLSSETDKLSASQKETDKQIKTLSSETDKLSASQKETYKQIRALFFETDKQMKRTDKKIDKIIGDSGNQWGKLGENLVKGSLVQRLKERGIKVERVITNAKNEESEFDIIAINGKEVVVVEVKASLDPLDVDKFVKSIEKFKIWWPEFKEKTVYGAMAFLIRANKQASSLAKKQGFFVIEATGDLIIQNEKDFKPKAFS